MALLQEKDRKYLEEKFEKELKDPVNIKIFVSETNPGLANENMALIEEIVSISKMLNWSKHDINDELGKKYNIKYSPTTIVDDDKETYNGRIRFQGIPAGYEFMSFIESIVDVSRKENDMSDEIKEQVKKLTVPVNIDVYITHSCPHCPNAVMTAHKLAQLNENITAQMIDASEFPELSNEHKVFSVPHIYVNDKINFVGALPHEQYLAKVLEIQK
jgi:glutaredoxin-like protein